MKPAAALHPFHFFTIFVILVFAFPLTSAVFESAHNTAHASKGDWPNLPSNPKDIFQEYEDDKDQENQKGKKGKYKRGKKRPSSWDRWDNRHRRHTPPPRPRNDDSWWGSKKKETLPQVLSMARPFIEGHLDDDYFNKPLAFSLVFKNTTEAQKSGGPKEEEVALGAFQIEASPFQVKISTRVLKKLYQQHGHQIAYLKITEAGGEDALDEAKPQVYVAGFPDFDCKHPILISDYDGTLSSRDRCTHTTLDQFLLEKKIPVFVVSSRGVGVSPSIKNGGFDSKDQFVVLDNMTSNSYGGGSNEKALRIARHLFAAGSCILGFAGDSEVSDGAAAKSLGIPFLAVNQQDQTSYKGQKEVKKLQTVCELVEPKKFRLPKKQKSCPDQYQKEVYLKVKCKTWAMRRDEVISILEDRDPKIACMRFGNRGRHKIIGKESICRTHHPQETVLDEVEVVETSKNAFEEVPKNTEDKDAELFAKRDHNRNQKNKKQKSKAHSQLSLCPHPSMYRVREKLVLRHEPIYGNPEPSLNIKEYPQGSFYSRDWCELTEELSKRIEARRPNANADASALTPAQAQKHGIQKIEENQHTETNAPSESFTE